MGEKVAFTWFVVLCVVTGHLLGVTAEPTVSAWIVTPEADRIEGGQVEMRCDATNLEPDHIVEWRSRDRDVTLRWGDHTITANSRFEYQTTHTDTWQTTQVLTITDLQRDDADEYICNVNFPRPRGGYTVVATARVTLSVLYFPNASFPRCFPDGPMTVDTGTELNMRCTSQGGNSAVSMLVFQYHRPDGADASYNWTLASGNDTLTSSLQIAVTAVDDQVWFYCHISSASFPGSNGSCEIGPLTVREASVAPMITEAAPAPAGTSPALASTAILVAVGVEGGLALLILLLAVVAACHKRGTYRLPAKSLPRTGGSHRVADSGRADHGLPLGTLDRYRTYRDSDPEVGGVSAFNLRLSAVLAGSYNPGYMGSPSDDDDSSPASPYDPHTSESLYANLQFGSRYSDGEVASPTSDDFTASPTSDEFPASPVSPLTTFQPDWKASQDRNYGGTPANPGRDRQPGPPPPVYAKPNKTGKTKSPATVSAEPSCLDEAQPIYANLHSSRREESAVGSAGQSDLPDLTGPAASEGYGKPPPYQLQAPPVRPTPSPVRDRASRPRPVHPPPPPPYQPDGGRATTADSPASRLYAEVSSTVRTQPAPGGTGGNNSYGAYAELDLQIEVTDRRQAPPTSPPDNVIYAKVKKT